ncbi:hypothetical protein A6R68_24104, partial [Neotoma lepida]
SCHIGLSIFNSDLISFGCLCLEVVDEDDYLNLDAMDVYVVPVPLAPKSTGALIKDFPKDEMKADFDIKPGA